VHGQSLRFVVAGFDLRNQRVGRLGDSCRVNEGGKGANQQAPEHISNDVASYPGVY
jgi:hypothetical protein